MISCTLLMSVLPVRRGATFDRALVYSWGQAMGKEFFDKGANVQLGPVGYRGTTQ